MLSSCSNSEQKRAIEQSLIAENPDLTYEILDLDSRSFSLSDSIDVFLNKDGAVKGLPSFQSIGALQQHIDSLKQRSTDLDSTIVHTKDTLTNYESMGIALQDGISLYYYYDTVLKPDKSNTELAINMYEPILAHIQQLVPHKGEVLYKIVQARYNAVYANGNKLELTDKFRFNKDGTKLLFREFNPDRDNLKEFLQKLRKSTQIQ